jgi:hypothetical protein
LTLLAGVAATHRTQNNYFMVLRDNSATGLLDHPRFLAADYRPKTILPSAPAFNEPSAIR